MPSTRRHRSPSRPADPRSGRSAARPAPVIRVALLLLCVLPAIACDILNPERRGPEDLLRYVQRAQQRAQVLQRVWGEIAPMAMTASTALGAPVLALDALAAARVTTSQDIPAAVTSGAHASCEVTGCTIYWSLGEQQRTWIRARYENGESRGFTQRITSPPFGTWLAWYDGSGTATGGTLLADGSGPVSLWRWQRTPDGFSGVVSQPGSQYGTWYVSDDELTGTTDLTALRERFPWRARPVSAEIRLSRSGTWLRHVAYADASSTYALLDTTDGRWIWAGPGVRSTTVTTAAGRTICRTDFDVDEAILRLDTEISRGVTATIVGDNRVNRLGARSEFVLEAHREATQTRTFWSENGIASGGSDILIDGPGWRVDAFWDLADGALITLQARVLTNGVWTGSFAGWAREDLDNPREQGEFLMLPDGSWSANVLLLQSDGSFAELPLALPPEGATARSVE